MEEKKNTQIINFEYAFNTEITNLLNNGNSESTIYFLDIYNNLTDYSKNFYYQNFDYKKWKFYEQNIDDESPEKKNIMWNYIKKRDNFCTISATFYKKKKYPKSELLKFSIYEYGMISFFISFIFLNFKRDFKYNIRFYINPEVKEILFCIIETIILYIKFYFNQ